MQGCSTGDQCKKIKMEMELKGDPRHLIIKLTVYNLSHNWFVVAHSVVVNNLILHIKTRINQQSTINVHIEMLTDQ